MGSALSLPRRIRLAAARCQGTNNRRSDRIHMKNTKNAHPGQPLELPFHSFRNISSPEDTASGRKVYAGHMPAIAVLDLPTNENVREYLVEAEGKQVRRQTQVHRAIRETLDENPDRFCVLNGGITIVASECEVDEKERVLRLKKPSIINGSQTQGVLKDFFVANGGTDTIHVKYELVVTDQEDLIAEISIARNFQNDVKSLSIVGRRGQLDELEKRFRKKYPKYKLQKSETEWATDDNQYVATEKLLQVIAALLPAELWFKPGEVNKVYAYNAKATCLKDFQEIFRRAHDKADPEHAKYVEVYNFYLDIAGQAFEIHEKWRQHPKFEGTKLRSIEREGSAIKEVPDGIIFPIIASLAEFAVKGETGWTIVQPPHLDEGELIAAAKRAYMEIASSKPQIMGKSKPCYSALQQITAIYRKLAALQAA